VEDGLLAEERLAGCGGGVEDDLGQDGVAVTGDVLLETRVGTLEGGDDVTLERIPLPLAGHKPEIVHRNYYTTELNTNQQ
jgi:hypothetical protein